jgi:hypothetical protein
MCRSISVGEPGLELVAAISKGLVGAIASSK